LEDAHGNHLHVSAFEVSVQHILVADDNVVVLSMVAIELMSVEVSTKTGRLMFFVKGSCLFAVVHLCDTEDGKNVDLRNPHATTRGGPRF